MKRQFFQPHPSIHANMHSCCTGIIELRVPEQVASLQFAFQVQTNGWEEIMLVRYCRREAFSDCIAFTLFISLLFIYISFLWFLDLHSCLCIHSYSIVSTSPPRSCNPCGVSRRRSARKKCN